MENKESLEEEFKKEVLKKIDSKEEQELMQEWIQEGKISLDFMKKIDEVTLPDNNNYVIFTDGKEQLVYDNGEFFVVSSTSSLRKRKKKTKKEATDMYLDYFIKYQLNPLLDLRKIKDDKEKVKSKDVKEIKNEFVEKEAEKVKKQPVIEKDDRTME